MYILDYFYKLFFFLVVFVFHYHPRPKAATYLGQRTQKFKRVEPNSLGIRYIYFNRKNTLTLLQNASLEIRV